MSSAASRLTMVGSLPRFPRSWSGRDLRGQRALVLGLGSFGGGVGAARYLCAEGAEVTITDTSPREALESSLAALEGLPIRYVLGENRPQDVERCDFVVASPAVPWTSPVLQEASRRGIPVESEITLLLRRLEGRTIGITGTNGKSTTTRLLGQILHKLGKRVRVGGNVGGSLLGEVDSIDPDEIVVLELSSFQLEHLGDAGLGPQVALVTNITPDHLDRHHTMAAYVTAKARILQRAAIAVLNRSDLHCRGLARAFLGRVIWYGLEEDADPGIEGRWLHGERFAVATPAILEGLIDLSGMVLKGPHNRLNLISAAATAEAMGIGFREALLAGFEVPALSQRLTEIAMIDGVRFVDDSVATSPPRSDRSTFQLRQWNPFAGRGLRQGDRPLPDADRRP